jgi:hypothetical protein
MANRHEIWMGCVAVALSGAAMLWYQASSVHRVMASSDEPTRIVTHPVDRDEGADMLFDLLTQVDPRLAIQNRTLKSGPIRCEEGRLDVPADCALQLKPGRVDHLSGYPAERLIALLDRLKASKEPGLNYQAVEVNGLACNADSCRLDLEIPSI